MTRSAALALAASMIAALAAPNVADASPWPVGVTIAPGVQPGTSAAAEPAATEPEQPKPATEKPATATEKPAAPAPVVSASAAAGIAGDVSGRPPGAELFNMAPGPVDDPYGPRPPDAPQLTRDQVVQHSLHNPYVKAAEAEIEAMQQTLLRAKFAWVPSVATTLALAPGVNIECDDVALQGSTETFQLCRPPGGEDIYTIGGYLRQLPRAGVLVRFSFDLVIPVYTFGKLKNVRNMAEAGLALRTLDRERVRQETVLRVYQAHAALLLARESIGLLEEVWKAVGEARGVIEKDLGGAEDDDGWGDPQTNRDPADLTRLELVELELAARMLEAREIEAMSMATLWALAGASAPPGFDIAERLIALDELDGGLKPVAYYRELSARERPEAGMATQNVELRQAAERLARSSFLPDFGVLISGKFGYMSAADRDITREIYYSPNYNYNLLFIALGMNWKLDFHNYTWNLRKARAERKAAEHRRDAANALLALEVDRAYRRLQRVRRDVDLTSQASQKARSIVVQLQVRESVGGGDFKKLGDALKDWAEWRFKHLQALYLHNVAAAELSRAVGTSVATSPPAKRPEGPNSPAAPAN